MALSAARTRSSEIADDGKRPFTVVFDVTPNASQAVVAAPAKKRVGFTAPCDLTVIQAILQTLTTNLANATYRLKISSATVATFTGSLAKVFVSGLKFGGATNIPIITVPFDMLSTGNSSITSRPGLVSGWPKATTGKRNFTKGDQIVLYVSGTTAASKLAAFSVTLVCVPR